MPMMAWGWDVISFVFGSRIVVRFGWSLARGWRPAEVLGWRGIVLGFFVYGVLLFPEFVHEFSVCFVDDY